MNLNRFACIAAAWLWSAWGQAQIGTTPPTVHMPLATCTNMELMKQVPCPDSTLFFLQGRRIVQEALNGRDFKALDELYDQWCTGKDRFPDGRWKLSQYGEGLKDNFSQWNTWSRDLDRLKAWKQARWVSRPTAMNAICARTACLFQAGWRAMRNYLLCAMP